MARYRDPPTRVERATIVGAVVLVHVALGALLLSGSAGHRIIDRLPVTKMFDVAPPPPPPPPPRPEPERAAEREAGAPGRRAEPTPVVAPAPRIVIPAPTPLPAAPVAGTGSASSAGAAVAGSGTGAGGSGTGRGGGGAGGDGGGIGSDAQLMSGGLNRRDYRYLRNFAAPSGRAVLALLVGPDGRVSDCSIRQSSGSPPLDNALCGLLQPRMQWSPARDRAGRPVTVGIVYTAVWSRD